MVVTSSRAVDIASDILALSKAAWNLGSSVSKLDQDTKIVDTALKYLAEEVKSLGNICNLICAELEDVSSKNKTGSNPLQHIDARIWDFLATQVKETSRTMQELEHFVNIVRGADSSFVGQAQRQRKLDKSKDRILSIRIQFREHADGLRTTLVLITVVLAHITPCRGGRGLAKGLNELQDMVEKLQKSSKANPQSRPSFTEVSLIQYAREIIVKGTNIYEASLKAESVTRRQGEADSHNRVAEWVSTLESIRRDQRLSDPSDRVSSSPSVFSGDEALTTVTNATSVPHTMSQHEALNATEIDSNDDLDIDLAKAALGSGTSAFEVQDWDEADAFLQEALRILQQLPKGQRTFCDIFSLQYRLAVCAYHTQEPTNAEEALMSVVHQSASSDEQRGYICNAYNLLSYLYIRKGQIDRARSECGKALQARRRLLGKLSDVSLESTSLMAHIYTLLNNRARARSYLALIPEAQRDAILARVEASLGTRVENLSSSLLLTRPPSGDSDVAVRSMHRRQSASSDALPLVDRCYDAATPDISQSRATGRQQEKQGGLSMKPDADNMQSPTLTSYSSVEGGCDPRTMDKRHASEEYCPDPDALGALSLSQNQLSEVTETFEAGNLSRKEILKKIGCQPKDRIEDAVCEGDQAAFASLLNKNKDFWRSKLRKRVRPERVTALHFAALFGEIDMAQRLLSSNFNINEVPYGYSTSLSPLKFAVGARQVDMVQYLIANGARPVEPDSWSTLAGQLMNRSWLMKTMSEAAKENVPNRMIAILKTLLKHGWDVNAPFEASGATVLHQAVTFWIGSYRWDLNLRAAITSFLCETGANPLQPNMEGKTPYELALASGHQELLLILDQASERNRSGDRLTELVELPSKPSEAI